MEDHQLAVFGKVYVQLRSEPVPYCSYESTQRVLRYLRLVVEAPVCVFELSELFQLWMACAAVKEFVHYYFFLIM